MRHGWRQAINAPVYQCVFCGKTVPDDQALVLYVRGDVEELKADYGSDCPGEPPDQKIKMDRGGRYDIQTSEPGWFVKSKEKE